MASNQKTSHKNILILLGHPGEKSLCASLAESYRKGAQAQGAQVTVLNLVQLEYSWNKDPRSLPEPDPQIQDAQAMIKAADHIVWVYPLWWGGPPAVLKGFVDQAFRSGFAFRYNEGKPLPEGLLKGKSSRIIITMDSPTWWHALVYRKSGTTWLRWATLWFSGIKPVKTSVLDQVRKASSEKIGSWLSTAENWGRTDS